MHPFEVRNHVSRCKRFNLKQETMFLVTNVTIQSKRRCFLSQTTAFEVRNNVSGRKIIILSKSSFAGVSNIRDSGLSTGQELRYN